jgi:hypothetical protein
LCKTLQIIAVCLLGFVFLCISLSGEARSEVTVDKQSIAHVRYMSRIGAVMTTTLRAIYLQMANCRIKCGLSGPDSVGVDRGGIRHLFDKLLPNEGKR